MTSTTVKAGMGGRKRKIPFEGAQLDATEMEFTPAAEHFNEYLLEDGTVIKVKMVALHIYKVDGHKDDEGNPLYVVQSRNVMTQSVPDYLRGGDDE